MPQKHHRICQYNRVDAHAVRVKLCLVAAQHKAVLDGIRNAQRAELILPGSSGRRRAASLRLFTMSRESRDVCVVVAEGLRRHADIAQQLCPLIIAYLKDADQQMRR